MKLFILSSAKRDLADGYEFYEKQAEGLGMYYLESLFSDIESLKIYAGIHRQVFGCHRLLAKRFPYAIYYSFENQTVLIRAILDCRQNPSSIRKHIRARDS